MPYKDDKNAVKIAIFKTFIQNFWSGIIKGKKKIKMLLVISQER